jgi:hypothetical protein
MVGFFDWLKPRPRVAIEQLSYDVAYHVFPHYVFEQLDKVLELHKEAPETAGGTFYLVACRSREVAPYREDAMRYRLQQGRIDDARMALILEYPTPRPVAFSGTTFAEAADAIRNGTLILAPWFSAAVRHETTGAIDCFAMGQTSIGDDAVVRRIDREGSNMRIGACAEPKLHLFLAEIRRHLAESA